MFKAAINAELLKDAIASLAVIVDEVRFRIKPEGISVKAVDPANVAMVTFELGSSAFDEYSADECEIEMTLTRLQTCWELQIKGTQFGLNLKKKTINSLLMSEVCPILFLSSTLLQSEQNQEFPSSSCLPKLS